RVRIRRRVGSVRARPRARRLNISLAHPSEGLPEESLRVDRDTAPQSQLPPLTSRLHAHKTTPPSRYRAILIRSLRFQIVSGAIANGPTRVGALRGQAACRNAFGTPPRSRAFHSTTANRGPIRSSTSPVALVEF